MAQTLGSVGTCKQETNENDPYDSEFRGCGSITPVKIFLRNYQIRTDDKRFAKNKQGKVFEKREVKRILEALSFNTIDC